MQKLLWSCLCFLSILVTSSDEEFWSRKQPLPRIYVKGSSPQNNTVPEDIRECISMTIFVKLWRILAIFWQRQNYDYESVEKIVRFYAILQEWIKISYKNAKLWDKLSPNSVNWSQVKRILTNPVPKLGNRVTKTPHGWCHLGWTQFEKSAFIAVFYWLVKDPQVINPLAPYLIRKGTDSASFCGGIF